MNKQKPEPYDPKSMTEDYFFGGSGNSPSDAIAIKKARDDVKRAKVKSTQASTVLPEIGKRKQ